VVVSTNNTGRHLYGQEILVKWIGMLNLHGQSSYVSESDSALPPQRSIAMHILPGSVH